VSRKNLVILHGAQAAREGNIEALEWMMEKIPHLQVRKKRLNQRDDSKLTPLHYAARYNHRRMIEYLVENGASKPELKPLILVKNAWSCCKFLLQTAQPLLKHQDPK